MSPRATTSAALPAGFTKPPRLGVHVTAWRLAALAILTGMWVAATWGRLHPAAIAVPPILLAVLLLATIYTVPITRWAARWTSWRRHRRDLTALPDPTAVRDVPVDGAGDIGVVLEGEQLITMIAVTPDPLAPSVVTATEERTVNTLTFSRLAELLRLADVELRSLDVITAGARASGGFADLYQQLVGTVPAAASRTSWLVLRVGMLDNLAAIRRRAGRPDAPRRTAAVACQRAADALAADGLDARPATAAEIQTVNDALHAEPPLADHWSHLESRTGFTATYYADPDHIGEDAAQWWTWPGARDVTTLIRLARNDSGHPQIAALVRYRTPTATAAPPVSRLGPLYGVQRQMWQQFCIGAPPAEVELPWGSLTRQEPVIAFGPTGPMIGTLGTAEKAAVHLPLVAPISISCPHPLLLRQLALRATATGRPLIVVTSAPQAWEPIVANATAGQILAVLPDQVPAEAILVIDGPMPLDVPDLTVLTSDPYHESDITLTDLDEGANFTLTVTRTGLTAQLRAVPSHEERRLLGVAAAADGAARARPGRRAPTAAPAPAPSRSAAVRSTPAARWGEPAAGTPVVDGNPTARHYRDSETATAATPVGSHLPPAPGRISGRHSADTYSGTVSAADTQAVVIEPPQEESRAWPSA